MYHQTRVRQRARSDGWAQYDPVSIAGATSNQLVVKIYPLAI
ncbi:hypothetical protein EDWATA_00276 [Edwardsiella tarda ATCC 23685]|uniref:Uncharacterized protein n=1 Tax=Edwardsiella tarda ATCC 23685 TaxID=500638 RepID=D4F0P8_EDWTA|nr:hypothetical protein EDWATA_00276 [Edwardsiella tarda ATCC 23685]